MTTTQQDKIIKDLRDKTLKIEVVDEVKTSDKSTIVKIDKKTVWEKAKQAGKTINDDSLPTPHTAGA